MREIKSIKSRGKIYISARYLCFEVSVLGLATKEVIPFQKMKDFKTKDDKIICVTKKKKV